MEARAIQRMARQSPRKMRLVIDLIRGRAVPEAYAILRFSKKRAAQQIHKVLKSAVANAEQYAQRHNEAIDVDRLRITHAVVNAGQTLKRFTSAAMGRATPIRKRTSHVEIRVAEAPRPAVKAAPAAPPAEAPPKRRRTGAGGAKEGAGQAKAGATKRPARKAKSGAKPKTRKGST